MVVKRVGRARFPFRTIVDGISAGASGMMNGSNACDWMRSLSSLCGVTARGGGAVRLGGTSDGDAIFGDGNCGIEFDLGGE